MSECICIFDCSLSHEANYGILHLQPMSASQSFRSWSIFNCGFGELDAQFCTNFGFVLPQRRRKKDQRWDAHSHLVRAVGHFHLFPRHKLAAWQIESGRQSSFCAWEKITLYCVSSIELHPPTLFIFFPLLLFIFFFFFFFFIKKMRMLRSS